MLKSSLELFIICISLLLCHNLVNKVVSCESSGPIVDTPWARIQGLYQKVGNHEIKAFLGIPYASPPVGFLRFRKTVPLTGSLKGVYLADHFRFACMQTASNAVSHADNATLSENCLFLNIWTPRTASQEKRYPVFVYAHGSAHVYGSTKEPSTRGDFLSGFGDIVVVTMEYRLGALGLGFDGHQDLPGNMAIHDIIQSLQWIRSNIQYFGGDPDEVTLSGMSAGSIYACMIFIAPSLPSGLFNKLVLMSGIAIDPPLVSSPEVIFNLTERLSKSVGCSNDHSSSNEYDRKKMECLMRIKAEKIVETQENIEFTSMYGDSFLMPDPPRNVLKNGGLRRGYSILIGTEEDEDIKGTLMTPQTKAEAKTEILMILHELFMFSRNLDFNPLIDEYFADIDGNNVDDIQRVFHAFISDAAFHCPSLLFAEKFAERNTVHLYRNEYLTRDKRDTSPFGARHSYDARAFLGDPFRELEMYDDDDRAVSKTMMEVLGSFVKGQPLPWSPVQLNTTGTDFYRWRIQEGASFKTVDLDPDRDICWKWSKYFKTDFKYSPILRHF